MISTGLSLRRPLGGLFRNRPDTDFGSGGHITQPWPSDPVDYQPKLRHGLKVVCWNLDWLSDLFAESADGTPALKPEDMVVRGPSPPNRVGSAPTVAHRLRLIKKAIIDLDPDIVIVLEGPNRAETLEYFFNQMGFGEWKCRVQESRYTDFPGGPQVDSSRCIGLAVRTDTGRLADEPIVFFNADDPESAAFHDVTQPFFSDRSQGLGTEWFRFETLPLYAEIVPSAGAAFRILAIHLKSKGVFAGYDWSRWMLQAELNRARFLSMAHRLRHKFLDIYLSDRETRDIPLLVMGGLNEGLGSSVCDNRGMLSAAEVLMGSVWSPELALGNALFDASGGDLTSPETFEELWTVNFSDPVSDRVRHRAWVDHVLYSRNAPGGWCAGATIPRTTLSGISYDMISDHFPVTARIDTTQIVPPEG